MKAIFWTIIVMLSTSCWAQFGPGQLIYEHPISGGRMIRTADFDQDGDQDAVIAIFDFIAWYPNDGDGNFGEPVTIDLGLGSVFVIHAVDVDNDTRMDLVVSYFEQDEVKWYRNLGGGVFSSAQLIASNLQRSRSVISGDIDDDGDTDLVLGVTNGTGLYWVENLDGLGDFSPLIAINTTLSQARAQAVGDVDGDGDVDVLSNAGGGGGISLIWFENVDGNGDFSVQHILDTGGSFADDVVLADIDDDNDLDILESKGEAVVWRENVDGMGTFGPLTVISALTADGSDVHVADLDNDGDLDVLSTSLDAGNSDVAWYEHLDGMGTFGPQQLIDTTLLFPRSVTTADLDNDGDLEVLASCVGPDDKRSLWYENYTILGNPEFDAAAVKIYPNPVHDILYLESNTTTIASAAVYDVLGRRLLVKTGAIQEIDLSGIPAGLIFIEIGTAEGVLVEKVIKD